MFTPQPVVGDRFRKPVHFASLEIDSKLTAEAWPREACYW
jgi:hypothetical protein